MTQEEAGKKLSAWVKYMENPNAVPELDQPCTDDEIIEAMSVAGKALSWTSTVNDGLDEAAERWAEKHPFNGRVSSFKAGAEWQKDKMLIRSSKKEVDEFMSRCDRDVLDELDRWRFTTACQEFIEQGIFDYGCAKHFAEWMKAKMMKNVVEGMVCATITGTNAISFLSPFPDELSAGDKVRVIVIKEDK